MNTLSILLFFATLPNVFLLIDSVNLVQRHDCTDDLGGMGEYPIGICGRLPLAYKHAVYRVGRETKNAKNIKHV